MITGLRAQGFKSWEDTGHVEMAPLTGLFGTNSSGKTAILQCLLMLKQTVESVDRSRVLHTGDERSYVDLGTFYDIVYGHHLPGELGLTLDWQLPKPIQIDDPEATSSQPLFTVGDLHFENLIQGSAEGMSVRDFAYTFTSDAKSCLFGMKRRDKKPEKARPEYDLTAQGYTLRRSQGRAWPLPAPVKCYGFPDQVNAYYQNAGFLSQLVLAFEQMFQDVYYLGPLREYPHRSYVWAGEQPRDVGQRGELAVPALLAARSRGKSIRRGRGKARQSVEERVAEWLRELGLIHSFKLEPIAENRNQYEVRVRRSAAASEVLITDVGFGVSQILPVLVLCYYAPEGATIILEQPEIHLHPAVQAGLADVFIDAIASRKLQIILESHSEHLLRRLQRRVAEEQLRATDAALYFVGQRNGASQLERLDVDLYGNIRNWPTSFFGDEMGEIVAMSEAALVRQIQAAGIER
jgi:predicted ATPase